MLTMPLVGLGTYKLLGEEGKKVIQSALELGYRHIDTADAYQNHEMIGRAIVGFPREELYLVTKLDVSELLPEQVMKAVPRFLSELKTDYIDLLLIHWPNPHVDLAKTLETMILFKEKGLIRQIGVSNFVRAHLEALDPYEFPIFANQIEMHPYLQRRELVSSCEKRGIAVVAYRPLAKGAFEEDKALEVIGRKYNKSASQIALRWLLQQNVFVIPKASSLVHLERNLAIFDFTLSSAEMDQIALLDQGKRFCTPADKPLCED